jgi:AcrR family transcriptional regulator
VITSERLLEVAREVFLELGFRATTAEVAKRAGVAEGTIFHRFNSKEQLFRSAMSFDPEEVLAFVERLPSLAGGSPVREILIEFAEQFMHFGRVALPVMMMSWSNPDAELCDARGARYKRVLSAVSGYFQAEMRGGRLRPLNPEVPARMLLGSLHQFCMSELFSRDASGLSLAEFASEVVDVLLVALAPTLTAAEAAPSIKRGRGAS